MKQTKASPRQFIAVCPSALAQGALLAADCAFWLACAWALVRVWRLAGGE